MQNSWAPPGQFPSKFSALPGIGGSAPSSPVPGRDNQIVPYTGMRGSLDANEAERLRQLESRISVSERSNRALLEEVVRLQSELKANSRRSEDLLREERTARQQMENALRSSNDLITQLSSRLKRAEDKVQDERSTLSALMNQTKSVEQAVIGSQQELMSRRDLHGAKIDEMKAELDEAVRAKDSLERVTYQMMDEVRQLKTRLDSQTLDFSAVTNDLKLRNKKLEEDNRQARLDSIRKTNETHSQAEQTTHQLRSQVEIRLSELRDVVVDLRNKQDTETQERRMLEQQTQLKVSDLQANVAEQSRKRDEALHAMETLQRERDHAADTERIKLQSKIAEIAEQVTKKQLQKEMKLREENQQKFAQIEQSLIKEQEKRQTFEKDMRDDLERRIENHKRLGDDDLTTLKEQIKADKRKNTETLHNLDKAVNLIEKQNDESKKQQEKLLSAEIKSRKQAERTTLDKVEDLQEKIHVATSTLQHAIGGMSTQMASQADKIRRELRELIEDNKAAETRHLADLDARLLSLSNRLSQSEDMLESKIATASAIQAQNIREKVESIAVWQGVTQQTIRELQAQNQQIPQDVFALEEKHKLLKSEIDSRVGSEAESRISDVKELKDELEKLKAKAGPDEAGGASSKDIEALQSSIRKLAESIQTVKTVLGMKIQSEQKMREASVQNIQEELDEIQEKLTKLDREKADKEEEEETEEDEEDEDDDEDEEEDEEDPKKDEPKKDDDKKDEPKKEEDKKDDDKKKDDDEEEDDEDEEDDDDEEDEDDDKKDDDKKDDDKKDDDKKDDDKKDDDKKDDDKKDDDKKDDNKKDDDKKDDDNKGDSGAGGSGGGGGGGQN